MASYAWDAKLFRHTTLVHVSFQNPACSISITHPIYAGKLRDLYDQRARTTVLVCLASILERSNEQTLPALYKYVGRSLDATPKDLGYITLACAVVQALFAPVGGLLGASLLLVAQQE